MDKQWVAEVKSDPGHSHEVSVCYGEPAASWGWFSREKIRMEDNSSTVEQQRARAEKIAAALNSAAYDPNCVDIAITLTCAHGYTVCAVCKFPITPSEGGITAM